ncbi:MAG: ATP synthase F0 subunit C [Lachnospiraceae bacterium]|nr:ATP synthase F0 subunit C [Lachnospiraceae bacterium]MEE3461990.1 ATP synthase F0 subunit C [Lachnospiraceae bacterium]
MGNSLLAIGAGIAMLACSMIGYGIGSATGHAVDAVARQPEASGKIQTVLILGCALAEATAIYCLLIALFIILFLK